MVALKTPMAQADFVAPDFTLPGTDGAEHSLASVRGEKGLLVMFICNHCPYVQRQLKEIVSTAKALQDIGIGVAAISANDADNYPEDSFERMKDLAQQQGFSFPYLYDESQQVAKAYDAVCTPDFFGFDADFRLRYRGRLSGERGAPELLEAMQEIAEGKAPSKPQKPSIGCSIKWK